MLCSLIQNLYCCVLLIMMSHSVFRPVRVSASSRLQTQRTLTVPHERLPHPQPSAHTQDQDLLSVSTHTGWNGLMSRWSWCDMSCCVSSVQILTDINTGKAALQLPWWAGHKCCVSLTSVPYCIISVFTWSDWSLQTCISWNCPILHWPHHFSSLIFPVSFHM